MHICYMLYVTSVTFKNMHIFIYIYKYYLGLTQDLNLEGDMDVSSSCSITNVKKHCSKIGLLSSVLYLL